MMVRCVRGALVICLFAASLYGQSRDSLLNALQSTADWKPAGAVAAYTPANIDSYSANLAPSLKRYGLKGVTVQAWQGAGARVRVNLFEMLDAGAAYGFFSIRRAAEPGAASPTNPVGAESFQAGSRLYLWQGNYVVRIEGEPEAARMKMANALSEKILGRSRKPPVSNHLPPRNLTPGSDKYILDAQNVDRGFGPDPVTLGFDDDVGAIVSGAADASAAQSILDDVNYETKVTWNQRRPNLGIGEIILTVFTFIGIGLLFTLVAGLSFGGVRIFVKSRYPNRLFDRPEDMEIIQLRLNQGLMRKELGP
jgi:hypothetical protein